MRSALIVLKKEMTDIIRDKRTLFAGILLPLVLYPIMFGFLGSTISSGTREAETDTTIAFMNDAAKSDIRSFFTENVFYDTPGVKIVETNDPVNALASGEIKLILNVPDGTAFDPDDPRVSIELIYDEDKMASSNSFDFVRGILSAYNEKALIKKLEALGISPDSLNTFEVRQASITEFTTGEAKQQGNIVLSMIVPMLMCVFMSISGMTAGVDIFAGEKERKTLEPLLATKAPRYAILTGKFLAVAVSGLITTFSMLGGLTVGYMINPSSLTMGTGELAVSLPAPALILAVVLVLLMTMVFTGIHMSLSAVSKNIKEASTYSSFVMLAGMIPAYGTMMIQAGDIKMWMMAVPVYNVLGAMKMILGGSVRYDYLTMAVICSVVFLIAVLALVKSLFGKETVMFRM